MTTRSRPQPPADDNDGVKMTEMRPLSTCEEEGEGQTRSHFDTVNPLWHSDALPSSSSSEGPPGSPFGSPPPLPGPAACSTTGERAGQRGADELGADESGAGGPSGATDSGGVASPASEPGFRLRSQALKGRSSVVLMRQSWLACNSFAGMMLLVLCILITGFYFAAQGLPLLDLMVNDRDVRRWVGVTPAIEVLVDIVCIPALARAAYIVFQLTWRWRRTVRRYLARDEAYIVIRARTTIATLFFGVRYFLKPRSSWYFVVVFLFEANEFFWQALGLDQMARDGVAKDALLIYTTLIFVNAFSPLALIWLVPRINRAAHQDDASREAEQTVLKWASRLMIFDACGDCCYALFPLAHLIGRYAMLYGTLLDQRLPSVQSFESFARYSRLSPDDLNAFMLFAEAQTTFMGGNSPFVVVIKFTTRFLPLILAPSRIRLAFATRQSGIAMGVHSRMSLAPVPDPSSPRSPRRKIRDTPPTTKPRPRDRRMTLREQGSQGVSSLFNLSERRIQTIMREEQDVVESESLYESEASAMSTLSAGSTRDGGTNGVTRFVKRVVQADSHRTAYKVVPWWAPCVLWIIVAGFCGTIYVRLSTWGECEIPQIKRGCVIPGFPLFQKPFAEDRACACNSLIYDDRTINNNETQTWEEGADPSNSSSLLASVVLNSTAIVLSEVVMLWVLARPEDSGLIGTVLQHSRKLKVFLVVVNEPSRKNETTGRVNRHASFDDEPITPWIFPDVPEHLGLPPLWAIGIYEIPLSGGVLLAATLGRLSGLHMIELRNNGLTEIPSSIGKLTHLKQLSFYGNAIEAIPVEVGELKELRTLQLSHNRITELPDSLGNLEAVIWFKLDNNNLQEIPGSLNGLSRVQYVDLANNKLSRIPASIMALQHSVAVFLDSNRISALPGPENGPVASVEASTSTSLVVIASNPVCDVSGPQHALQLGDWEITCTPFCSPACLERDVGDIPTNIADGNCYESCNTRSCDLDGGDCRWL